MGSRTAKAHNLGMNRSTRRWAPHPASPVRAVSAAIVAPALVTLLAIPKEHLSRAAIAVIFVLAVVLAARVGGAGAGVGASVLSFLSLNFFFTPPLHTFVVGTTSGLVALLVFLSVAVIVGLLLSSSLSERHRAEQREVEARLSNRLATRLLAGDPVDVVLTDFARQVTEVFELGRCEVSTSLTGVISIDRVGATADGEPLEVGLSVRGEQIGTLRAWANAPAERLDLEKQQALMTFGSQLALALESIRLSDEVRRAEFAAETNRLKAELFAGVTHDVKTPLAAITASITSLLDGAGFSEEERREHLDMIRQEVSRLDRVVNNLLDLARLRAGAIIPRKFPGALDELIESVVVRLRPLLDGRAIDIQSKDDLVEIPMDVVQMDQVLTNLIENAIKFSPTASPLFITLTGHRGAVRVTVADRGPGVRKEDRERIFEPFERADGTASGTGLGLAIARAIIVAHGGRMWVTDAPGGGAAFTFELPTGSNRPVEEVTDGRTSARR